LSGYTIAKREDVPDWMAEYPGFGEMRWYTEKLGSDEVSFSWRSMPPGTGGRGSYGHRHPGVEEIYFVISGVATFKVGDDVFEASAKTAVRMTGEDFYSVHNDTDADVELLIFNARTEDLPTDQQDEFWPE
jgi:mannose-6-phosphate isomerase-like protein (cupin superfamily)